MEKIFLPQEYTRKGFSAFPICAELLQFARNNEIEKKRNLYIMPRFETRDVSDVEIYLTDLTNENNLIEYLGGSLINIKAITKRVKLFVSDYDLSNENCNDAVNGSRLNFLVQTKIATGFVLTLDWFGSSLGGYDRRLDIVFERAGKSIIDFLIDSDDITTDTVRSIFAQLLLCLESAQYSIGFVHYDLHPGNVFVQTTRVRRLLEENNWLYRRPDMTIMKIDSSYSGQKEVKLIDFGRCRMEWPKVQKLYEGEYLVGPLKKKVFYWNGEYLGINEHFNRSYDIRRFSLGFVRYVLREKRIFDLLNSKSEWDDFLHALNKMSGHSYVIAVPPERWGREQESRWDYMRRHDNYVVDAYHRHLNPETRLPDETVVTEMKKTCYESLEKFKRKGCKVYLKWCTDLSNRTANFRITAIDWFWIHTKKEFPDNPTTVLNMNFFRKFVVEDRGYTEKDFVAISRELKGLFPP